MDTAKLLLSANVKLDGLECFVINVRKFQISFGHFSFCFLLWFSAICKEGCQHGHCSQPGECICHPGWFGPNCDQCVKLPGCTHNGYCTKPMECKCQPGWTGHFCHKPICRPGCNETTGFCSKPGECWCRVGWTGPKCETCVPYPGCQNGFCEQPWECKCTGDYVGMLCDKLASETTTVQFHPTTLPPLPPQNTGQPFTIIQGLLQKFLR